MAIKASELNTVAVELRGISKRFGQPARRVFGRVADKYGGRHGGAQPPHLVVVIGVWLQDVLESFRLSLFRKRQQTLANEQAHAQSQALAVRDE